MVMWRPVPSYPDILASEEGEIVLPPRYSPLPNGGYRSYLPEPTKGVVMRSRKDAAHAYYGIRSRYHGTLKIHQLICEAYHGLRPFDNAVVMHLDEDGLNNHFSNLRWGTQKENMNAPGFIEYCRGRTGENSPVFKARLLETADHGSTH